MDTNAVGENRHRRMADPDSGEKKITISIKNSLAEQLRLLVVSSLLVGMLAGTFGRESHK